MPLGPRLLAAEALRALFAALAEVQPRSCTHPARPFFRLSTAMYSPKARCTDKELCEDQAALGRAEIVHQTERTEFHRYRDFWKQKGGMRKGKRNTSNRWSAVRLC